MSLLRELFGPSKKEVWQQLSERVAGEFVDGGWFGQNRVQIKVRHWIVTLDTYTVSTGQSSVTYTRMRAPYLNHSRLAFTVYRKGIFSGIGRALGIVPDIEVGDPHFDKEFIIQANQPHQVRALFQNRDVRRLLQAQPKVYFHVASDEGWFGPTFPDGVDELLFKVPGVIKDIDQLEQLFELFSAVLHQLCHLDPRYDDDFNLLAMELLGPGGTIERDGLLLWDGDERRRRAAEALVALQDRRAVASLRQVIDDPDPQLRHVAIEGLGRLGDEKIIPGLIVRLGHHQDMPVVKQALTALGEGEIAAAFVRTIAGDAGADAHLRRRFPQAYYGALIHMLDSPEAMDRARAAQALARTGEMHAVQYIRRALRRTSSQRPTAREILEKAIDDLEARASLPRPVDDGEAKARQLPRGVNKEEAAKDVLPRPADEE